MGQFVETLNKMTKIDKDARFQAKLEMMKRHGISMEDLEKDLWEFREEGVFGKTVMRLYKLVDCVEVRTESKVKAFVEPLPTADSK